MTTKTLYMLSHN